MENKPALLSARNIRRAFTSAGARLEVLRGVDLSLRHGESLALTGESGSGKSTLVHILAGLELPDAGEVEIEGTPLNRLSEAGRARLRRETIGIVFQQFNLIPSLDAGANIAFQARLAGRHDPDHVTRLAGRLGLAGHLHKYPEELSGGQQQRVAIGRALAARPALILADEPTGNLDEATADEVLALMLELVAEAGAALLMVTHSVRLAARLDRQLQLSRGRIFA
ncbi:putative ABC transport system ATP-binding protein [Meinhardsimonia xiamenensis]|jgi:putative ABC transport system ATP-binding protein|uniref:Putative ABC transport system ATP-binding protein n=1 Tax=Meinhardsimonia xiamenensis TaxID=990712 RepID=A0A1G9FMN7_9RHOB|nr:ABC transporter ATP-binding protein [Meinhardsimonia xiamenensis]PRX37768.1 putative ABC transport system ATP-binding protein [Meinhardsimonia xiamenensis]SDK89641.1 putative ABC transport system ATP-binding protein [Meinhardsimonia xiamenensis]